MLDALFIQILNMSFSASFVILAVFAAKCVLTKAPRTLHYALWSVVLFRLLCPVTIESAFSPLPIRANAIAPDIVYAQTPQVQTGLSILNEAINPLLPAGAPYASANPLQIWLFIAQIVWILGILALILYNLYAWIRLRRHIKHAVCLRDTVYIADAIPSPFVMGLVRPKIYLPAGTLSEKEQAYIILHEQMHIRRFDPLIKTIAFAALVLHWFNPLVWAAFFSCMKDMEMSCDERVLKRTDADIRRAYSASLLRLASENGQKMRLPPAFGESSTKARVKHVMRYQEPTRKRMAALAFLVCAVVLLLLLSPKAAANPPLGVYSENTLPSDSVLAGKLELQTGGRFQFMYSALSSYLPIGSYKIESSRLICQTDDGTRTYVFHIEEDTLVFLAEQSSSIAIGDAPALGMRTYTHSPAS